MDTVNRAHHGARSGISPEPILCERVVRSCVWCLQSSYNSINYCIPSSWIELLCNLGMAEWEVIRFYSRMLIHKTVLDTLGAWNVNKKDVVSVTSEQFGASVILFLKHASYSDGKLHSNWLFPASIICLLFVRDPHSVSDKNILAEKAERRNNTKIIKNWRVRYRRV